MEHVEKRDIGASVGWAGLSWGRVLLSALAILVGAIFAATVVTLAIPAEEPASLIAQAAFASVLIAVPVAAGVGRTGSAQAALAELGLRPTAPGQALRLAAGGYAAFFCNLVVYGLLVQPEQQPVITEIASESHTAALIALGILVICVAPLSEEVFFRGFLFGGLRARFAFWPAALISGAIFGSLHLPAVESVPPLALFGVVLAWVYERTGSIWPAIGVHALQNSLSFAYAAFG